METHETNPLMSSIQWLEEEHRQGKAVAFKAQQQVDQVQAGLWAQGDRLHQLEQSMAAMAVQAARVSKLEDELRHSRELIERLQGAQSAGDERSTNAERLRQADLERERQELTQLLQKLESADKDNQYLRSRLTAADEHVRRLQDGVAQLTHRLEDQSQQGEGLQGRLLSVQDQLKRKDQEISRVDSEQDALRKQDELQLGRIQVLGEQVRRVEELGSLRELESRLSADFNEKLEVNRMERQRLERLVTEMGLHQEQQRSRVEELAQASSLVEGKVTSQADYVSQLREQLWGLRDDVISYFSEALRIEEHQKRRTVADLEQQLLEVKNRASRIAAQTTNP